MERVIFHCDCNSFFASVELLSHPELRDVPVAVCGNPENRHGIILAKNEPAKRFGVQTAETISSAQRKCPDLRFLPPHHDKYKAFSKTVNAIYARFTDRIEPFGIDESWLDMTHTWKLFGTSPVAVANELRRTVKNETGLTISVGVSFNKVFAKLGSDYKKPDAVTVFDKDNFKQLIWPMPVSDLLYVGKATQRTLREMGIRTIGELAAAEPESLRRALGKLGAELSNYARGEDDAPVRKADEREEIKSVGNGLTFKRDLLGEEDIRAGVTALADEVAGRLRRYGLYAKAVQLTIKDTNLKNITRQQQLVYPTNLAKDLTQASMALAREHWRMAKPIRMLTVTALNLTHESESEQLSLFEQEKPNPKRVRLEQSLDKIRDKYGKHSIAAGRAVKNDLGLDGITFDTGDAPDD